MKTEYSRRSVLAVGALALIDTAMTRCSKAQTDDLPAARSRPPAIPRPRRATPSKPARLLAIAVSSA